MSYGLKIETEVTLDLDTPWSYEREFYTNVKGTILHYPLVADDERDGDGLDDDELNGLPVGQIEARRFRWGAVVDDDLDPLDCAAATDQNLFEATECAYGILAQERGKAGAIWEGCGDLIYIEHLWLEDEHRGNNVGMLVMQRFLEEANAAVAILEPRPHVAEDNQLNERELATAVRKLAGYWKRFGFTPCPPPYEKFVWLDLTLKRPPLRATEESKELMGLNVDLTHRIEK